MAIGFQIQIYSQFENSSSQRNVWFGKPDEIKFKIPKLHTGRLNGLVNTVLVWTDLVRSKRSGLVNRFKIGTNRTGPKHAIWTSYTPANTGPLSNAGLMLVQRRGRWANMNPALADRIVLVFKVAMIKRIDSYKFASDGVENKADTVLSFKVVLHTNNVIRSE